MPLRRPRSALGPWCRCTHLPTLEMQAPTRCWACYTPPARLGFRTILSGPSSPTAPRQPWAPSPLRTRSGSCFALAAHRLRFRAVPVRGGDGSAQLFPPLPPRPTTVLHSVRFANGVDGVTRNCSEAALHLEAVASEVVRGVETGIPARAFVRVPRLRDDLRVRRQGPAADEVRHYLEQVAAAGDTRALSSLGMLHYTEGADSADGPTPGSSALAQAQDSFERAATAVRRCPRRGKGESRLRRVALVPLTSSSPPNTPALPAPRATLRRRTTPPTSSSHARRRSSGTRRRRRRRRARRSACLRARRRRAWRTAALG